MMGFSGLMAFTMLSGKSCGFFLNTIGVYDAAILKSLGHLVANVAIQKKETQSCTHMGTWKIGSMNTGNFNRAMD